MKDKITKENIQIAISKINRMINENQYIFVCNPNEKITQDDLPENVELVQNICCEMGKGFLIKKAYYMDNRKGFEIQEVDNEY